VSRRQAGFTLLEIIVVLVIMAVAVAVVGVNMAGSSEGAELRAAARGLASGFRYARSEAIVTGREQVLIVDTDARRYWLTDDPGSAQEIGESVSVELTTAESEVQGESQGGYRFFPDGSATGGRVTLTIGTDRRQVDVDWVTGRIRIGG